MTKSTFVQANLFGIIALVLQLIFIIIIGIFFSYGADSNARMYKIATYENENQNSLTRIYPMFQDVQGMIFLGFGFLMTFLKKYSFSSVGVNFFISALAIQWALIIINFFYSVSHHNPVTVDIEKILLAEFACAAVLISFGAILGKVSPLQLLIMAMIQIPIYVANEVIGRDIIQAIDIGDSLFVHCFGAYFGLFCSRLIYQKKMGHSENEGSSYNSDIFAMIGTLVLWIFWPSFNAVGAVSGDRHRAVVNTICSLLACTVVTFAISSFVGKGKFNMVHIQNATLAGGVAVGASADLMLEPWGAMAIGFCAGTLSTLGYHFITPRLNKIGFHDTCGVHNLHGMPAVLAGIASIIACAVATSEQYGDSLYKIFPARAPSNGTIVRNGTDPSQFESRSASTQALMQLAALGVTLIIAAIGGSLAGLVMRIPQLQAFAPETDRMETGDYFSDSHFWEMEGEDEHHHDEEKHELMAMRGHETNNA